MNRRYFSFNINVNTCLWNTESFNLFWPHLKLSCIEQPFKLILLYACTVFSVCLFLVSTTLLLYKYFFTSLTYFFLLGFLLWHLVELSFPILRNCLIFTSSHLIRNLFIIILSFLFLLFFRWVNSMVASLSL